MVQQSLLNKRIVVTRAEEQAEKVISMLREVGASVILVPTIKVMPAALSAEDASRISRWYEYDIVVFTSTNAVRNFISKIVVGRRESVKPYIIAIGEKTAAALAGSGIRADFIPLKFTSDDLIKSLSGFDWKGKRVLLPVGNLFNHEIAECVKSNGGFIDQVVVYENLPNDSIDEGTKSEIRNGEFDLIVFYSPSQVKNFVDAFGIDVLKGKQIAAIGPTTKKAVEHYKLSVSILPNNSTTEDLIESLIDHEKV